MNQASTVPYGAWPSPISTQSLVTAAVRLGAVRIEGTERYWLEGRPAEGGRSVLVRSTAGRGTAGIVDLTPAPFNVRTRAHEYGGGAYAVSNGTVWFCNDADQRVYQLDANRGASSPVALTPEGPYRYADLVHDAPRRRLIAVREVHHEADAAREPTNQLVTINLDDGAVAVLAQGHDFFASPALSPDGGSLMWVTWDHPDMPWVSSTAWLGRLGEDGKLNDVVAIGGGDGESVFQPTFAPDGVPYLVSDRSGWWNLYRWSGDALHPVCPRAAEFGRAQWQFGMRTFEFLDSDNILCLYVEEGSSRLGRVNIPSQQLAPISCGLSDVDGLALSGQTCLLLGGTSRSGSRIISFELNSSVTQTLRTAAAEVADPDLLSAPQPVTFPTGDGESAHGFFYPPRNGGEPRVVAPAGAKPPLIVIGHGGPTAATSAQLDLRLQFWTSRGFGVLDVNYRGSTGYGRAYRDRLEGTWGVVDVEDCVAGASFLGEQGLADPERLAIRGSSAGGYTTLAALCFHDTFAVGASHYGICDLEVLAQDTHKFESRYLDWLIGPYPEARDLYRERSPIHHVDRLSCPIIFFQGLEDKVVPPNQAQMMADALDEKGLPVACLEFEGEQHGFRQAATIRRALSAELYFYSRVFGFEPAVAPDDEIQPVAIKNLA